MTKNLFFELGNYLNDHLGRCATLVIILGLLIGNNLQTEYLRLLLPFALFLIIFPAMLGTDIKQVKYSITHPGLLILALTFNFFVCPVLVYLLTNILNTNSPSYVIVGVVFFGLVPGAGIVLGYTEILKGNVTLAVTITIFGFLLNILIIPLWVELLLGRIIQVPFLIIIRYLMLIIFVPMVVGQLARRFILSRKGEATFIRIKSYFKVLSGYGFMLMVFIIISMNGRLILESPLVIVSVQLPIFLFLVITMVAMSLVCRLQKVSYKDSVALTLSVAVKNVAIAIAIAMPIFGKEVGMVLAIAGPLVQLPTMLSYLWFVDFLNRRRGHYGGK